MVAYNNYHEMGYSFIYGYFLLSFFMFICKLPQGIKIQPEQAHMILVAHITHGGFIMILRI
jgi:hypothetical protein